ncbi:MAG TPA: hypothetical protein VFU71_04075 [Burkholderiaceae bacterium]|nr:hypothetical protein [Burkholderiaceae bacterium]
MRLEAANRLRHRAGSPDGHYESYFVRANHATRALAFWIRYTIFSPQGHPDNAQGELWAIVFDGERAHHVAVKQAWALAACRFDPDGLAIELPVAQLGSGHAQGSCQAQGHHVVWDLRFAAGQSTLLLLPERLYEGGFPKAKSLVSRPLARFDGGLSVDGQRIDVQGWAGSQNHNWGRQHTDRYAWGQVAGFDGGHDESFLEVASAKLKIGPLWTPWLTPIVLRHRGREHRLNALGRSLRARASVHGFEWHFESRADGVHLRGHIGAERGDFVGLRYANPSGGSKLCLNSKIARAQVTLRHADGTSETLLSERRAAFELLADDGDHGVPMSC